MITYKVREYYTAEAAFPLTDERCNRSLNEFGPWAWDGDFPDSAGLSDFYKTGRAKLFEETIAAKDRKTLRGAVRITDSLAVRDAVSRAVRKYLSESLRTSDRKIWHRISTYRDSFSAYDEYFFRYGLRVSENPVIRDILSRTTWHHIEDGVYVTDRKIGEFTALYRDSLPRPDDFMRRAHMANLKEYIPVLEDMGRRTIWKRGYAETALITSGYHTEYRKPVHYPFLVSDHEDGEFRKHMYESASVSDLFHNLMRWQRDFEENVTAADREYAAYLAAYKETCKAVSEWIHGPNGVLYDVSFSEGPMSADDFHETASVPAGYSPFVDFRVGEYEYKDAIYRFMMQKQDLGVNPLLYDLIVHVDIPDTNDRGTADIPNEVTKVHFNKFYYNPPEVVATVVGGMESTGISIPYILSTDKSDETGRYFEIVLVDANKNPVGGKISWTARGY